MAKRQDPERFAGKINVPGSPIQLKGWRKPYVLQEPTDDRNAERAMPYGQGEDDPPFPHRGRQ